MPAFGYNINVPNISQNEKRWAVSNGLDSEYWDIDMLRAQFRFKRPELKQLMSAMHLSDKFILLSRKQGTIFSNLHDNIATSELTGLFRRIDRIFPTATSKRYLKG